MISMSNVWDRTTEFLSDHLGAVLPISLVGIFIPAVISGNFAELAQGAKPGLALALGIGTLLLALVSIWGQFAIMALALDPMQGRAATRLATRRLPMALLVMLAMGVVLIMLAIPIGVILALGGVDLTAMSARTLFDIPPGTAAFIALYSLLIMIVVAWLLARLAVTFPAIIGERAGFDALGRSWRLTRGVALRIVGMVILYVVVSGIATSAVQLAVGSVLKLLLGQGTGLSLAGVLTTIIVAAVSTTFTVLYAAFIAKLFVALLAREGGRHEAVRTQ